MNRLATGGLACGLVLFLAAACGSNGLSTDGPFGNGGPDSGFNRICARPGQVVYDGFEEFPNTGGTATVERVALVDPRNLRLVAAWVVPTPGGAGVGQGYPSVSSLGAGAARVRLDLRQRIPGPVVRHTRGQEAIDLVIVANEPDPALAACGVRSVFLRGHSGSQLYLRGSEISRVNATPCGNEFL